MTFWTGDGPSKPRGPFEGLGHFLKLKERILQNTDGADETDAIGVEISLQGSFVHQGTHDVVRNEDGVKLLNDPVGFETSKGMIDQP